MTNETATGYPDDWQLHDADCLYGSTRKNHGNVVLELARLDDHAPGSSMGDEFGWAQSWRSALADYLRFDIDVPVFGFVPSLFGPDTASDQYDQLKRARPTLGEAKYALRVLDRYRNLLSLAGRDY